MKDFLEESSVAENLLSDPYAKQTWYYSNSRFSDLKIDIESIWEEYSGKGVKVGVVDSQIDFSHSDLKSAYDESLDYNFDDMSGDLTIDPRQMDRHGTLVAGVIAAEGGNDLGSVGIAHEATLVGFGINYDSADVVEQAIAGICAGVTVDVLNCSWAFNDNFADDFNRDKLGMAEALEYVVENGRGGLGTNVVFAAGNAGSTGSSNYHNFQNSPYTIAVGAVNLDGSIASFSSVGANVLLSGPGVDVKTTSTNDRYDEASGTSFAAPAVSGVIALMLEANPDLGYRDVQQILALSSRREGLSDEVRYGDGWQTNGADNLNGGGMHYSASFGYGFLNAHDAVRLAETWTRQQTLDNMDAATYTGDVEKDLVAGEADHISFDIEVDAALSVEHVQLSLDLRWKYTGDLDIYLTSPEGTSIRLVYDAETEDSGLGGSLRNFTFSSVATMGELSEGTWMVDIFNRNTDATNKDGTPMSGLLDDFTFTVLGNSDGIENNTYFYTDEFATIYSNVEREVRSRLEDTNGGVDAINAAAVTSDSIVDLSSENGTEISGVGITIVNPSEIENVFSGDGDDTVTGNAGENFISTGRGDDTIHFTSGNDTINGGVGVDTLSIDRIFDTVTAYFTQAGEVVLGFLDQGFSLITGVEIYQFSNVEISYEGLIDFISGGDTPDTGSGTGEEPTDTGEEPTDTGEDAAPAPDTIPDTTPGTGPETPPDTGTDAGSDNVLYGSDEDDNLSGTDDSDTIEGYAGNDDLKGNAGDDLLFGGAGSDRLRGNAGHDVLEGGDGADTLLGLDDDDTLYGGDGDDELNGGTGDDYLYGGAGADGLRGHDGADTFVFNIQDIGALDVIRDFDAAEGDRILLTGLSSASDYNAQLVAEGSHSYLELEVEGSTVRFVQIRGLSEDDNVAIQEASTDFLLFG